MSIDQQDKAKLGHGAGFFVGIFDYSNAMGSYFFKKYSLRAAYPQVW